MDHRNRGSMARMYDRNKARIDVNLVVICFWKEMSRRSLRKAETAKMGRNLSFRRDAWSRLHGQQDRSKIRKMNAHQDRVVVRVPLEGLRRVSSSEVSRSKWV